MRRRIREQARWARPRLIAKSDPNREQICAGIRDRIAALPQGSVVLAEDETHLDLLARLRSCWMPTGLRHRILTPGTNVRRTVHGAVNLATGAWHYHVSVKTCPWCSATSCSNYSTPTRTPRVDGLAGAAGYGRHRCRAPG
jgi:hypothetical protein